MKILFDILGFLAAVPTFFILWKLYPSFIEYHYEWNHATNVIRKIFLTSMGAAVVFIGITEYGKKYTEPTEPVKESRTEVKKSSNDPPVQKNNRVSNVNSYSEPINTSSKSTESIEEMEKRVGYSGDDPIIRSRLGLPPKQ